MIRFEFSNIGPLGCSGYRLMYCRPRIELGPRPIPALCSMKYQTHLSRDLNRWRKLFRFRNFGEISIFIAANISNLSPSAAPNKLFKFVLSSSNSERCFKRSNETVIHNIILLFSHMFIHKLGNAEKRTIKITLGIVGQHSMFEKSW